MTTEFEIVCRKHDKYSTDQPEMALLAKQALAEEARFALACIERWAMVAGELDGEDSAGRSKLRRMTPDELVRHACDSTQIAFSEFETRGWVRSLPNYEEVKQLAEERAQQEADEREKTNGVK